MTLAEALVEAAAYVKAGIVFATLPVGLFPWWTRFQLHRLRDQLARQQRILFDEHCLSEERR